MAATTEKRGSNVNIKNNEVVITEGIIADTIIFLQQGRVDFKIGSDQKEKYLYSLESPSVIGVGAISGKRSYPYSVVSNGESIISHYENNPDSLLNMVSSKGSFGVLLLRSLLKESIECYNKLNNIITPLLKLKKYIDSFSIGYSAVKKDAFKEIQKNQSTDDEVLKNAFATFKKYLELQNIIPQNLTSEFLKMNHLNINQKDIKLGINFDKDEFNYINRFSNLPFQTLEVISTKDPRLMIMTVQKMTKIFHELVRGVIVADQMMDKYIEKLINTPESWLEKISNMISTPLQKNFTIDRKNLYVFSNFFLDVSYFIENQFQSIWAFSLFKGKNIYSMDNIKKFIDKQNLLERNTDVSYREAITVVPGILENVKDLAYKVFSYSELPTKKYEEYQSLIKDIKRFKNPMDYDDNVRRIRKQINNIFWELYESVVLKHFRLDDKLPRYLEVFLNYSALEETLLNEEQIAFIYQAKENDSGKYPIHTAIEWLRGIHDGKFSTSLNELGLSFFDILRQNNKNRGWQKESDLPTDIFNPTEKVKFEIRNMFLSNSRLTSGFLTNYLAILTKFHITTAIEKALVLKSKLANEIDKVLENDFSCFHREVLFKKSQLGIGHEFIQIKVAPNFILIPSGGNIFQFWQEREGKEKRSPGRLLCPILATDDLYKMLLRVIGNYRWELTKTTMGPDWNNIAHSSITSDYSDYIQFFKRNKDLSIEAKEKLSYEFKRFRNDRAKFVNDYLIWVLYESEGVQRMNKVARRIFAKHIPFGKPIRDRLLTLPSYKDVITRSINIRRRKATELEPRYKKYLKMNDELPVELTETYKFYKMDEL